MSMHKRMRNMVIRNLGTGRGGQGVPLIFKKTIPGGYDRATGGVTPSQTITRTGSGVRMNYKQYAYANTAIQVGDFQIYMSPIDSEGVDFERPNLNDTLTFQGETVRIINVYPFNDNSENCGWKLQVRHG